MWTHPWFMHGSARPLTPPGRADTEFLRFIGISYRLCPQPIERTVACPRPPAPPSRPNPSPLRPIGVVRTDAATLPRHWSVSDIEGTLEIRPEYVGGLKGIAAGQRIVVLFHFDRSPAFTTELLEQTPPHRGATAKGVFGICSPVRPNPIGLSVLTVLAVEGGRIGVRGLDMLDGTPILDIKPPYHGRLTPLRPLGRSTGRGRCPPGNGGHLELVFPPVKPAAASRAVPGIGTKSWRTTRMADADWPDPPCTTNWSSDCAT